MRTRESVARHAFALLAMHRRRRRALSRTAARYGTVRGPTGRADPAAGLGCRPGHMRRNDRASRKPARPDARIDAAVKARRLADCIDAQSTELVETGDSDREAALGIFSGRALPGAPYRAACGGSRADCRRVRPQGNGHPLYDERPHSIHRQTLSWTNQPAFSAHPVG